MAGVNKVILLGNLGADPDIRTTPGGTTVANMRLAVSERWTDKDGQRQERTEWVTLVAWRKQAEIAQRFLRKGSKIYVEGKLQTRSWEDSNGGGKRYATEVVVDTFQMLDPRQDGDESGGERQSGFSGQGHRQSRQGEASISGGVIDLGGYQPPPITPNSEDDLPF